jgi:hypothetical protein
MARLSHVACGHNWSRVPLTWTISITVTLPEEVCDADGTTVTFKYDPFGRRIYKSF